MVFPDGTKFDGLWLKGKRHGVGVLTVPAAVFPNAYTSKKGAHASESSNEIVNQISDDVPGSVAQVPIPQGVMIIEGVWDGDLPSAKSRWSITFPTLDKYSGGLSIDAKSQAAPYHLVVRNDPVAAPKPRNDPNGMISTQHHS